MSGLHARVLSGAFETLLGTAEDGAMAFARCLEPEVARGLAGEKSFAPEGWQVRRVAGAGDSGARTIAADRAVEIRESKGESCLLLVDSGRAGAGMDGIYSAAREIDEKSLFDRAAMQAAGEITRRTSREFRIYAERAVRAARRLGQVSPWVELDFLCRVAGAARHPGRYLHLLGLWPVRESEDSDVGRDLATSRRFVERLLGAAASGLAPTARVDSLRLFSPGGEQKAQRDDLERFVQQAAARPLLPALAELADREALWVNAVRLEDSLGSVQKIELAPWRTPARKLRRWSGLAPDPEPGEPPVLVLDPNAGDNGKFSHVEIHWKAQPANLEKGCADYAIAIRSEQDGELVSRQQGHTGKSEEKIRFDNNDFADLGDHGDIAVKAVVSVVGDDSVEPQESEEFIIRRGDAPESESTGGGKSVRTFSEGLIELGNRDIVTDAAKNPSLSVDSRGFVTLRPAHGKSYKSYRVFRPRLIHEIEREWIERNGEVGRWRVDIRATGETVGKAEFEEFKGAGKVWDRAADASQRMAERFKGFEGGVGHIYDDGAVNFKIVREYIDAWTALWEEYVDPTLALFNTVEVRSLSGRTVGLIVPPAHPLRVAWAAAYDNLMFHAKFKEKQSPKAVRDEFACLDGAMFPALLPGLEKVPSFVFVDTLGFHAVGMAPDGDPEPRATAALLARALAGGTGAPDDAAPAVGRRSADVLASEIVEYAERHEASRLLHIHALRAGDGAAVARALGEAFRRLGGDATAEEEFESGETAPAFVLELWPSAEQRGIAGRFIAEARENRRRGAGSIAGEDRWMLESVALPGGVNMPRLRWARREKENPDTAAHISVAFDTFDSRVKAEENSRADGARPLHAFGLLSFLDRTYAPAPSPSWRATLPVGGEGEKHPSKRAHSERLTRMQDALGRLVARNLGVKDGRPVLRTDISPEKAESLRRLHRLSDRVVTLDRNAGVEYFDSPRDDPEIYDAYVIDCAPEREELGCLRLMTSTGNLDDVHARIADTLDRMGLGRRRLSAEFLFGRLKALSGRLAIRLTGEKAPGAELIALALAHAACAGAEGGDECWTPLEDGFLVPVDDIHGLAAREEDSAARPNLVHVSRARGARGGLRFRFVDAVFCRRLRTARAPDMIDAVRERLESLRRRWRERFGGEAAASFRAVRRAKLARVLRFHADRARRHGMSADRHEALVGEIRRMIEKGGAYAFADSPRDDRGWVFCPEYAGAEPLEISPAAWNMRIFLFGPDLPVDSHREAFAPDGARE